MDKSQILVASCIQLHITICPVALADDWVHVSGNRIELGDCHLENKRGMRSINCGVANVCATWFPCA